MQFSADKVHVVSGSDDGTVRVWDVAVGEEVNRLVGHTDYVRAVAASPQGPEIFASGGYDHMCRIWDVRTQQYVGRPPSESLLTWPLRVHPTTHRRLGDCQGFGRAKPARGRPARVWDEPALGCERGAAQRSAT
jgi:WD40 repeat protein